MKREEGGKSMNDFDIEYAKYEDLDNVEMVMDKEIIEAMMNITKYGELLEEYYN
jgi:hypothetical protein